MSKIALLFPGQGAQKVGMGRALADTLPAVKALYDQAANILGYDLAKLCFEGPPEVLNATEFSQPALYVTNFAALESLRSKSPQIIDVSAAAAGLSLGEYTALAVAKVFDFETGLKLVQLRGEAMQEAADRVSSGMFSILGLEETRVEDLCAMARGQETLEIANLLCPGNIVVSGDLAACERVVLLAQEAGAMRAVRLDVAGAFHTELMRPAAECLAEGLAQVPMNRPEIPVIFNVDAKKHDDPEKIRELLIEQLVSPVQWEPSMRYLLEEGFDQFYEVGPGRVLRGLLRRMDRKLSCESIPG